MIAPIKVRILPRKSSSASCSGTGSPATVQQPPAGRTFCSCPKEALAADFHAPPGTSSISDGPTINCGAHLSEHLPAANPKIRPSGKVLQPPTSHVSTVLRLHSENGPESRIPRLSFWIVHEAVSSRKPWSQKSSNNRGLRHPEKLRPRHRGSCARISFCPSGLCPAGDSPHCRPTAKWTVSLAMPRPIANSHPQAVLSLGHQPEQALFSPHGSLLPLAAGNRNGMPSSTPGCPNKEKRVFRASAHAVMCCVEHFSSSQARTGLPFLPVDLLSIPPPSSICRRPFRPCPCKKPAPLTHLEKECFSDAPIPAGTLSRRPTYQRAGSSRRQRIRVSPSTIWTGEWLAGGGPPISTSRHHRDAMPAVPEELS